MPAFLSLASPLLRRDSWAISSAISRSERACSASGLETDRVIRSTFWIWLGVSHSA